MRSEKEKAIEVRNLDLSFGDDQVLHDICLSIEKGKFYSIVGPNGSGKTTLFKAVSKILGSTKGKVFIDGADLRKISGRELARKVSMVPQNTVVDFEFSVMDIVLMGRTPYIKKFGSESEADMEIAKKAMEMTNIWHLRHKSINEVSGGERQRVIIARAIAQDTDIILLDEPISHIDLRHQIELLDTLRNLNRSRGVTVVTILHDLNLAAEYSDEIVLMDKGRVLSCGSAHEVLTKQNVEQVYNIEVDMIENPRTKRPHIVPVYGQFLKDK